MGGHVYVSVGSCSQQQNKKRALKVCDSEEITMVGSTMLTDASRKHTHDSYKVSSDTE